MLAELLETEGYDVDTARDGQRGLHLGLTREHDVLLLDRGLPAVEGLDLLSRLRGRGVRAPALVLSALANPADRVEGLDAGAEDYLGKPFDVAELVARLRALRRRAADPGGPLDRADALRVPGGVLDVPARRVRLDDGRQADLSAREADLLALLARRPSRVWSRQEILGEVFPESRDGGTVDTYVHYLRRKLGRAVVTTVHGLGYRLGAG